MCDSGKIFSKVKEWAALSSWILFFSFATAFICHGQDAFF